MKEHSDQATSALHRRMALDKAWADAWNKAQSRQPESPRGVGVPSGDMFRCRRCHRSVTRMDGEPGINNLCGNCWGKD